jgi:transcriptional regulator with GAF, ATPase, and Fis domain
MFLPPDYEPEFASYKNILLEMAQQRSADILLERLVQRLSQRPHLALVCIWLLEPGDKCPVCEVRNQCQDQTQCLHLKATSTNFMKTDFPKWHQSEIQFRRVPLGFSEIGNVAVTGNIEAILGVERYPDWMAHHPWASDEGVIDFSALPLRFKREEVLGVIGFYSRISLNQPMKNKEGIVWLRLLTNQAAIFIANTRAFEQIEQLKKRLELENIYLKEELQEAHSFGDIIGQSPELLNVIKQIDLVAPTDASVLILGESGTGKELVAREVHKKSLRHNRQLIKVNCASIPRELYESEFFGHAKGAFTGALKERAGRFEAADGGTLFLDEVGEIPGELQGKLLRVLQDGQYERVGEDVTRKVNVRLISASNRDLKQEVAAGRFRQDLFYRLNVFPIEIAPLRQRREDIPLLASQFLKMSATKMNRPNLMLTKSNILALENYAWPGNVRELQNVIERAVITSQSGSLHFDTSELPAYPDTYTQGSQKASKEQKSLDLDIVSEPEIRHRERQNIIAALEKSQWKIYGSGGAAELLGLKPTTLCARIKKMNIKNSHGSPSINNFP